MVRLVNALTLAALLGSSLAAECGKSGSCTQEEDATSLMQVKQSVKYGHERGEQADVSKAGAEHIPKDEATAYKVNKDKVAKHIEQQIQSREDRAREQARTIKESN